MKLRNPSIVDLLTGDRGATAVEYAVILALILITAIGAITLFGSQTGRMWTRIDGDLQDSGLGK